MEPRRNDPPSDPVTGPCAPSQLGARPQEDEGNATTGSLPYPWQPRGAWDCDFDVGNPLARKNETPEQPAKQDDAPPHRPSFDDFDWDGFTYWD